MTFPVNLGCLSVTRCFPSRDAEISSSLVVLGNSKRAVARDVSTNGDKFFVCGAERPPDDSAFRDWPTVTINDATSVGVWRSRRATSDRYGRGEACRER